MNKRIATPMALGALLLTLFCAACDHLSPTPLGNLDDLQTAPGHLNAALQEQEPETYAGLWIEQEPEFRVIALFTRDGEKTLRPYIAGSVLEGRVEVREVQYTLAELTSTEQDIYQMLRDQDLPFSAFVDVKENQVTVLITDQAMWESTLREMGRDLPEYVVTQVVYEPLKGTPGFSITPVPGLFFPQLRARSVVYMEALLEGRLILENGCLRVVSGNPPASSLIVWQPDYFPTLNGQQVEILNRDGQVVARVGEPIALGGGGIQLSDSYTRQLREPIPAACEGPYFLAGSFLPQPRLTPEATATPRLPVLPEASATATPALTATGTPIVRDQVTLCPGGAPAISLGRNSWAQVSLHPPISSNIRSQPGLQGEKIGRLDIGETVWIVDGPRCADGYTWWFVHSMAGLEGWTVEGDSEHYWLIHLEDMFFYDTVDQSSTSRIVLSEGQKYRITLSGTYSLWVRAQWTDPGVCIRGNSEPLPMFPSPGQTNGPVGADPFYQFAHPFYGACGTLLDPGETISQIMLSLDDGQKYSIPTPTVAQYREDHVYTYEIIGRGFALKVRLDDAPLYDNYGRIRITIEKID